MSLINDALKRAKAAQQNAPREAPELQFRPTETDNLSREAGKGSLGVLLPVALAVMALLLAFLVWQRIQDHRNQIPREITVRAVKPGLAPAPPAQPLPQAAAPRAQPTAPAAQPPPPSTPASTQDAQLPRAVGAPAATIPAVGGGESASTNLAPAPPVTAPQKPALPKLQGVVWNPSRPSALINGQVVFVGDRIGDYKVLRITASGVTLAVDGKALVLTLP